MKKRPPYRFFGIALLLGLVTALHFLSSTGGTTGHAWHVFFRKLYFAPILLGAFWFGFRGAVITVLAVSSVYLFHIDFHWSSHPYERADQIGEIASFIVLALTTGFLVRLEERLRLRAEQMRERARKDKVATAVAALAETLGARDTETLAHSRRVAAMARDFACWLKLPPTKQNELYLAGLLHDIGKIGIRDDVLLKPEALTPEDAKKIREHPRIAERILAPIGFGDVLKIVASHHERVDGRGYPDGLEGNAISAEARMLAVVDTFDALHSTRPYKQKIETDERVFQIMAGMADKNLDRFLLNQFRRFRQETRMPDAELVAPCLTQRDA